MEKKLRRQAVSIFRAALAAADPVQAVLRHAEVSNDKLIVDRRRYALKDFRNIYVIGCGKAGASMARALERLLGRRITKGLVNVKYSHVAKLRRVELNECGHPVPDEAGVKGAQRIAAIASEAGKDDLVLCVISGGGSALLPFPALEL